MAGRVRLRCAALGVTLRLPWWPDEISRTPSGWNVSSLERFGRTGLDVPVTLTTPELSMGFTLRNTDYRRSVQPLVDDLERIAAARVPVQVLLGDRDTGLWRVDPPQITEVAWAADDTPSVVDVTLTCKRASDAIVRVGPVRRVKGRGKNMARRV